MSIKNKSQNAVAFTVGSLLLTATLAAANNVAASPPRPPAPERGYPITAGNPEIPAPMCTPDVKYCHGGDLDGTLCLVNADCPGTDATCWPDCWNEWAGASCVIFDTDTSDARCYIPKNRYVTLDPTVNDMEVAYHVTLDTELELDDQYTQCGDLQGFLGDPVCMSVGSGPLEPQPPTSDPCQGEYLHHQCHGGPNRGEPCQTDDDCPEGTCAEFDVVAFGWVSYLVDGPVTPRIWQEDSLWVTACEFVPAATYRIVPSTDGLAPDAPSPYLEIMTSHEPSDQPQVQYWGDVTGGPMPGMPGYWLPPNYATNFGDIFAVMKSFERQGGPPVAWIDHFAIHLDNFQDIHYAIMAFEGNTYPELEDICGYRGSPGIGHEPCDCATVCQPP